MHFFFITFALVAITLTINVLCREHPEGMRRVGKIAGGIAIAAVILGICFIAYLYTSDRDYNLKKAAEQRQASAAGLKAAEVQADTAHWDKIIRDRETFRVDMDELNKLNDLR